MTLTIRAASTTKSPFQPTATPPVSIVIPVRNGAHHLRHTLPHLRENLPSGWEIIVVDDHSADGSFEVARRFADQALTSRHVKSGPAARNAGAAAARGDTLVFLDADIRVTRGALVRLVTALEEPGTACTFAVYSEGRHLKTLGGRFKNIWVRHSYLRSPACVRWMNTAMAAIRRSDFRAVGGYDAQDDWLQGGNDIDFGRVVSERAGRVVLLKDVECDHLKEMSLLGLLRNDFNRTRGFFRLSLSSREIKRVAGGQWFGNISPGFMAGVVAAGLVPAGLLAALAAPVPGLAVAGGALLGHAALNSGFYTYALPRLGRAAPLAPAICLVDQLACAAGLGAELVAILGGRHRRQAAFDPEVEPAAEPAGSAPETAPRAGA